MRNIDKIQQMETRELAQFLDDNNFCVNCSEYYDDVDGIERWLETEVKPLPPFRTGMVISYFKGNSSVRDAVMLDDKWAYDFRVGLVDTIELRKSDRVVIRKIYVCEDGQFKLIWEAD